MKKSVLSLAAIVLSSVAGCASAPRPVIASAVPVEPPGTVIVEYEDRARDPVPFYVPVTSTSRNELFVCRYTIPQTGQTYDSRNEAIRAADKAGLTSYMVSEHCSSARPLAAFSSR